MEALCRACMCVCVLEDPAMRVEGDKKVGGEEEGGRGGRGGREGPSAVRLMLQGREVQEMRK